MKASLDNGVPVPDFLDSIPHTWSKSTHQNRIFIFDAFISHASRDTDQSRTLSEKLRAHGLRVWHDDEQCMDDARWALRLGRALRNSRYVIVVAAHNSELLSRQWVPIECRSALACEASMPGVSRLLIARITADSPVPAEFDNCKQFDVQTQLNDLVEHVRKGNKLPRLGCAPPAISLSDARKLIQSPALPAGPMQGSSNDLNLSKQHVLHAFMTTMGRALAETEADSTVPSSGLYHAQLLSQITLDRPVGNDEVQWLVPILESLTSVGHAESRVNACFGLRGLANWGASAAAIALRRVIVREENEDIVQLVAEWFGNTRGLDLCSLPAKDCARVLLMLPLTNVRLRDELLGRLPQALRVVALPGIVAGVTQRALDQLKSLPRFDEARARFEELRQNGCPTEWEVYFQELKIFVGAGFRLVSHQDHVPLPERVDAYLLLINEFARIELNRGSNMIWRMDYEPALLMPLATLSVHGLYRDQAMAAYRAILDAMEAPVRQDLEARGRKLARTKRELEQAARLFSIKSFRRGPYFEQRERGTYVRLTSTEDMRELMIRAEEASKCWCEDDTVPGLDPWAGVDLY